MKICFLTNIISPHQIPLAGALVELVGEENFLYIAEETVHDERKALGWDAEDNFPVWILQLGKVSGSYDKARLWMQTADILVSGCRYFELYRERCNAGLLTFYMSERWFKPPVGLARLLYPKFLVLGFKFIKLMGLRGFYYLPIGLYSAIDIYRMFRILNYSDCSHCKPANISFIANEPWANFIEKKESPVSDRELPFQNKIFLWAYYVHPSIHLPIPKLRGDALRVLWVGRMLRLKHVDTLISAVNNMSIKGKNVHLTLVGKGPDYQRLKKMAIRSNINYAKRQKCLNRPLSDKQVVDLFWTQNHSNPMSEKRKYSVSLITMLESVPIGKVRNLMRDADVYVLPSNGCEGWGVVVNEAMLEGCAVIASRESGAGITLINHGNNGLLFRSGDVEGLTELLERLEEDESFRVKLAMAGQATMVSKWTPRIAAEHLVSFAKRFFLNQQ